MLALIILPSTSFKSISPFMRTPPSKSDIFILSKLEELLRREPVICEGRVVSEEEIEKERAKYRRSYEKLMESDDEFDDDPDMRPLI